jgi:guanylate kinase
MLIVISGPSGSGKTTVVQRLLEAEPQRLVLAVSATTRAQRPGEIPGKSYHFIPLEEFERRRAAGEFLECAEVYPGQWYGTLHSEVAPSLAQGKSVILEIDVQGANSVLQQHPDAVTIFIEPPSLEVLEQRLRARRTETEQAIQRRLATARHELSQASRYRFRIVNNDLDETVEQIMGVLRKCWSEDAA